MTMQVHNRKDNYFAVFNRVNNAKREAVRAATANFFVQRLPCVRPLMDTGNCFANFMQEVQTKSLNAAFVIARCIAQFPSGWRQQTEFHFFNSASMELIA